MERPIDAIALEKKWRFDDQMVMVVDVTAIRNAPTVEVNSLKPRPMKVKVTTDDFSDPATVLREGLHRKHYFCPCCGTQIGHRTFNSRRCFGQGTVLQNNKFPRFCPDCGTKLEKEEDNE